MSYKRTLKFSSQEYQDLLVLENSYRDAFKILFPKLGLATDGACNLQDRTSYFVQYYRYQNVLRPTYFSPSKQTLSFASLEPYQGNFYSNQQVEKSNSIKRRKEFGKYLLRGLKGIFGKKVTYEFEIAKNVHTFTNILIK